MMITISEVQEILTSSQSAVADDETPAEFHRSRSSDVFARARCRDGAGTLTHLFFSDDLFDIARAKSICSKCPVSALCLDTALARAEPYGVWGGELFESGVIVRDKRPRGRPPKEPRGPLVVDEVPLPPHLVA
jgi:WhiB family redox-sensing transcriptional regulator